MKSLENQVNLLNFLEIRNYCFSTSYNTSNQSGLKFNYLDHSIINTNKYKYYNINEDGDNSNKLGINNNFSLNRLISYNENNTDRNPYNCLKIDNINKRLIAATSTGNIILYDLTGNSLSFLKKYNFHQSSIRSLSIISNIFNYKSENEYSYGLILSGDSNGNLLIWDNLNNIKLKSRLNNIHDQPITDIAFSNFSNINYNYTHNLKAKDSDKDNTIDNKENVLSSSIFIATVSEDKSCKVIDLEKEKAVSCFKEHNSDAKSVDWLKNASLIASSGKDKKIRFFDPRQKTSISTMHDCHKDTINRIRFHNSNSNLLLSASKDHNIKLIDFRYLNVLQQFNGHSLGVNNISWSPINNNNFSSVSEDGNIIHWEIGSEDKYIINNAHDKEVFDICYNNTGTYFVTGGKDASIKIWG